MQAMNRNNRGSTIVAGAVFLLFLLSVFCSPLPAREITDKTITWAVERELVNDEGVSAHLIDVETEDRIVTLSGPVTNLLAKDRAAEVASTVKGVQSVVNQINVKPMDRDDEEILSDIERALSDDPGTERLDISVEVNEGVAALKGTVDSWAEKQFCARIAKGVRGLQGLNNEIDVKAKEARPDSEIETEIKRRLEWDALVDDGLITVRAENGAVSLSGTVGSAFEKNRAYADAWISGVQSVSKEDLEINWLLRDKMRRSPRYVSRTDQEIERAVKQAFGYDPRVPQSAVKVVVDYNVVTLRGAVDNLEARNAAGEDARNTAGVWRVRNRIRVRPNVVPAMTRLPKIDERIEQKIRLALLRDPYLYQHEITVSSVNSLARLSGVVDTEFARNRAEHIASRVRGVVDVRNNLQVETPRTKKTDWEIKEDIEDELWWSPRIHSEGISVSVENGTATLVGVVDGLRERSLATENAYEGGAEKVQNYLRVKHGPAYYK